MVWFGVVSRLSRVRLRAASRIARLSIRIPEERKALIERAAAYSGLRTTDFTITPFSDRDRAACLARLDGPPAPNEALRQAGSRYRGLVEASED